MDTYIRKTWAFLIENGVDATYSTALNFMLLAMIFEATKEGGLSEKTRKVIWAFVEDKKTINELNLKDYLTRLKEEFEKDVKTFLK